MTRRITLTIIAIVIGATTVVGLGTTLLSYRSNRQQVVDEVAALTRNLAGIAQFSRSIPIGASNDCAAIKAEARRLLCEKLAATKEAQNEQLRAERDRLRVSFQLDGIAYVLYDTRRDIAIDLAGNATEDVELPEGIDPTEIDFERIVGGEQIVGVRNRIAYAAAGESLATREQIYVIIVATQRIEPLLGPTFRWFALSASIAVAVAAFVAWRMARRIAGPIQLATDATTAIAAGNLAVRIAPGGGHDELEVLSTSVNQMADSLQRSRGLEQQFLMSISHDLRTPLTNIRGYAEAIADQAAPDPAAAAGVIRREAHRLTRLVEDLLDLAKLNSNEFRFHLVHEDIGEIVEAAASGFRPEATSAGLSLDITVEDGLTGSIDPDRLGQVVANLLSNAIKFARHQVTVAARAEADEIVITVADDGHGIPEADLPHVFERLYRAKHTPLRKESGSGLGLAIVDQLVRGMAGTIHARSAAGSGTTFEIRFPFTRSR